MIKARWIKESWNSWFLRVKQIHMIMIRKQKWTYVVEKVSDENTKKKVQQYSSAYSVS